MDNPSTNTRYEEARRYVRDVRGFYTHALVYVLVNGSLVAAQYFGGSPRVTWFGWPMLGWGVGLLAHGVSVFALRGWLGSSWEERKIREYLDRHP